MVVHMLDPAVWEVNGVGSHLSNEILTIGLTHILITDQRIKKNLGTKLHCLAALPSCLVANSYPWSWFMTWFSRFYWFPWFPHIVCSCSTYPRSCPVLALFMAKVCPRVCVRNSIFKAETINMFKIDFIKSGWFLDVWFLGTYRGLGYGSQHGHGLYLQEYIIIVQYMDRIHASYMHMFKKVY